MNQSSSPFGYLTFSTLVHTAAAVSVVLLPQLNIIPEGNVSGEVIEITTTSNGPLPLGEDLASLEIPGDLQDDLPALAEEDSAESAPEEPEAEDAGEDDESTVAVVPKPPKPATEKARSPEPALKKEELLPPPTPTVRVVKSPELEELKPESKNQDKINEALAIAEAEEEAIEKALIEQERLQQEREQEALAAQAAAAGALMAQEEAEAEAAAKAAEEKAARLAAEKEAAEKAFQERLKRQTEEAEKARVAKLAEEEARKKALAEKARKERLAMQAAEKKKAALAAAAAARKSLAERSQQNGASKGTGQTSKKAFGSPKGQIRDYRDIVQLPGNVPPRYPVQARRNREQGEVKLAYFVQPDGSVSQVRILQSSGYRDLDSEAVSAVSKYRYQKGQAGWAMHPVSFELKGPEEAAFGRLRRAGP